MSIPILKQGPYLIASIQSSPSDSEWREMGQQLAERVGKQRSRGVVVDVTVLDLIDSFAARTLRESFQKACDILCLEMRLIPLDGQFRMDTGKVDDAIDDHTCCLVGIAGTTEYGMVDPIPELGVIAAGRDSFFHVDAAFGGMVLPFLKETIPFDFSVPGVTSIAVDPHKMGMSTIPSGCLLVRDPELICALNVDTPYLTVKQEFTLSGTRPGAPVAAALAVLEYLGRDGMAAIVEGCMKNTRRLIAGMESYGIPRVVTPDVNVATFRTDMTVPPTWQVSRTRQDHLRIVCMPHVHKSIIEAFLRDIGEFYA